MTNVAKLDAGCGGGPRCGGELIKLSSMSAALADGLRDVIRGTLADLRAMTAA